MVSLKAKYLLAAAAAHFAVAAAACNSDLLVDDLSNSFSTSRNNLDSWTSDDGSMASISASGGVLSFTPQSGAYYYETFPCQAVDSYTHVQFDIKAPASGAALTAELNWASSCPAGAAAPTTKTSFRITGLTGAWQSLRVPLSSFGGANLNAAVSVVIGSFSSTQQWQLDKVSFVCGQAGTSPPATTPTTSSASFTTSRSASASCSPLLVDDWASQSRLDFLGYNSLLLPTGHDGTMQSVLVDNNNHVTLTPTSTSSYFYSQVGCVDTTKYGGIALRIKAPAGTTFKIELSSKFTCDGASTGSVQTTAQLGWTFDGTEKLYSFPWSKFSGPSLLRSIIFSSPNSPIVLGPLALYCGSTPSAWIVPTGTSPAVPTQTVPAPSATASPFVIDTFDNPSSNSLGLWHGGDDVDLTWGTNRVTIVAPGPDYAFTTLVSGGCRDMRGHAGSYLHIAFSGHTKFSVSLQQNNAQCSEDVAPYPETRDSLEAARYATVGGNDIYIPVSHFNIDLRRVSSVAVRSVYSADPVVLTRVEIVSSVPAGVTVPQKLPSGTLIFACTRPNSFAFGIDDGNPQYAARLAQIVRDAGIKVTFFAVGAVLEDPGTGMADLYARLRAEGHQIALHSYTHPRMEGLPNEAAIDWEYREDYRVMEGLFRERSRYFRPPYGVEGARMRQRWAAAAGPDAYIVNWSVDVQDWLWAETDTPERQVEAFRSDVARGGNLVVMHFSYNSTVNYFPEFIRQAKATGKQIMRIDQCMEDPDAPPL